VQIIGTRKIDQVSQRHADWRASLRSWTTIVKEADWTCNSDIQQTFNSADPVGRYVVFNIAGNRARLVALVNFEDKRVTVKDVVSHGDYDRMEFT
jgi:mRNA interferase HigB